MPRRVLAAVLLLLLAAALLVVAWPQPLGIERQIGVAQLVSFRAIAALVAVGLALALLLLAVAARRARKGLAAVAVLVLAFAGVQGAVLSVRGWNGSTKAVADDLTVLSWNTRGDAPGAAVIAKLALAQKADIVVLPETSAETAEQIAVAMRAGGRPMWVHNRYFDKVLKARTTSLLISVDLGRYKLATSSSTPVIPSGVFVPVDGSGPTIVAAHPVAPVQKQMRNWRSGLEWLADHCTDPDVIMAGDFNSTLDHWDGLGGSGAIGNCRDGARETGAAALGTWPTDLPEPLGTAIDHVVAGSAWSFTSFDVITTEDQAGSDHRPIVAHLHRTSTAG
jgi:endonuclease/exonuclease/phosphatase (EEP) superfamily protein YafD